MGKSRGGSSFAMCRRAGRVAGKKRSIKVADSLRERGLRPRAAYPLLVPREKKKKK